LDDPALLNAVMLTFTFAVTGGVIDRECLRYQTDAVRFLRETISGSDDTMTTISTLGAILLLAGVEV